MKAGFEYAIVVIVVNTNVETGMIQDHFNPATYMVIDRLTGEEVDVAIFIEDARQSGWEKAYAEMLADYIGCAGVQASTLLAWFLKKRNGTNLIMGTQREISESTKVSLGTVRSVMKTLYEKDFIKKVRSGCYMLTPKMIRNGKTTKGAMLLRLWDVTK